MLDVSPLSKLLNLMEGYWLADEELESIAKIVAAIHPLSPGSRDEERKVLEILKKVSSKVKELSRDAEWSRYRALGIVAPTAWGKTAILVPLSIAMAMKTTSAPSLFEELLEEEEMSRGGVTLLTSGKAARNVAIRYYALSLARLKKLVGDTDNLPTVLIMQAKPDVCVNCKIKEDLERKLREGKVDKGKVLLAFYHRCQMLKEGCIHYRIAREHAAEILDEIRKLLGERKVAVVGEIPEEVLERLKEEGERLGIPKYEIEEVVLNLSDVLRSIAERRGWEAVPCPFEVVKHIVDVFDIVVMDMYYILLKRFKAGNTSWSRFVRTVFNEKRLVIVDEAHALPPRATVSITISRDSRGRMRGRIARVDRGIAEKVFYLLEELFGRAKPLAEVDPGSSLPEVLRLEVGPQGCRYTVIVPIERIPSDILERLRLLAEKLERRIEEAKKEGRRGIDLDIAQVEVQLLRRLANLESGRISSTARRSGTVVIVRDKRGTAVRYHIVPITLATFLRYWREEGRGDYGFSIAVSATLAPQILCELYHMPKKLAERVLVSVDSPIGPRGSWRRMTVVVRRNATFSERENVRKLARSIVEMLLRLGYEKFVVIASSSWKPLEVMRDLFDNVIEITSTGGLEDVDNIRSSVADRLARSGKVAIHLSPHTSMARGETLAPPDRELRIAVLVLGEGVAKPSPVKAAKLAALAVKTRAFDLLLKDLERVRRLGTSLRSSIPYVIFERMVLIPSIFSVVQALGRFQRSPNHELLAVLIGRGFLRVLKEMRYPELYNGSEDVATIEAGDEDIVSMLETLVRGWVGVRG